MEERIESMAPTVLPAYHFPPHVFISSIFFGFFNMWHSAAQSEAHILVTSRTTPHFSCKYLVYEQLDSANSMYLDIFFKENNYVVLHLVSLRLRITNWSL